MTSRTALLVGLIGATFLPVDASAELYTRNDNRGRTVVTNLPARSKLPSRQAGELSVVAAGRAVRERNADAVAEARRSPYVEHVAQAAARYMLSPRLLDAVIAVESGYDPLAVSSKGAQGLMQLMPETARELNVDDPFDPAKNIHGGAAYLRQMLDSFGQDLTLALAAYNAGPGAVRSAGGVPRIPETRDYVRKVKAILGVGSLAHGQSSLKAERRPDGHVTVTNLGGTQSSLRLRRQARGTAVLTNR